MLTKQKKIQHLYWRAGFGIGIDELKAIEQKPLNKIVDNLFLTAKKVNNLKFPLNDELISRFNSKERPIRMKAFQEGAQQVKQINIKWVKQMANTPNPLLERMTLFWHGHFACIIVNNPFFAKKYNNHIRKFALGNFKDLVLAIAKDGAMIRFLNNQQNNKKHPNENFARELLELFTIGRGNYTEKDIKESARAFTGWKTDNSGKFKFIKNQHDFGEKVFMGKKGNFSGEDIVDIILKNKNTARFIVTKIYKYFVNNKVNSNHIESLTNLFYNSAYDIKILMHKIFSSKWFYDVEHVGTKVKSPIDLIVGIYKTLDLKFETDETIFHFERSLGQILFRPPNVAGWQRHQNWIDNSSLITRLTMTSQIIRNSVVEMSLKAEPEAEKQKKTKISFKAQINLSVFNKILKNKSQEEVYNKLSEYLLQAPIIVPFETVNKYVSKKTESDYIKSCLMRITSLPEYQLC